MASAELFDLIRVSPENFSHLLHGEIVGHEHDGVVERGFGLLLAEFVDRSLGYLGYLPWFWHCIALHICVESMLFGYPTAILSKFLVFSA